jgi:hypothetical protein
LQVGVVLAFFVAEPEFAVADAAHDYRTAAGVAFRHLNLPWF